MARDGAFHCSKCNDWFNEAACPTCFPPVDVCLQCKWQKLDIPESKKCGICLSCREQNLKSAKVTETKLPGGHIQTLVEKREYHVAPPPTGWVPPDVAAIIQDKNEGLGKDYTGAITGEGVKKSMSVPKLPLSLIPPLFTRLVAEVLKFGAKKYAPNNWMCGMSWEEVLAGVMRHIQAFREGQEKDPETGIAHLAHAACGIMFLLWYSEGPRRNEYEKFDDRLFKTYPEETKP